MMSNSSSSVTCGNPRHPNGAWHPATPYPMTLIGRLVMRRRGAKYGCGCAVTK